MFDGTGELGGDGILPVGPTTGDIVGENSGIVLGAVGSTFSRAVNMCKQVLLHCFRSH